jgi:hypothetical protein
MLSKRKMVLLKIEDVKTRFNKVLDNNIIIFIEENKRWLIR